MAKITVISQEGKLVGSWIPPQSTAAGGPVSTPAAGPGQAIHEMDVEDLDSYVQRKAFPELHRALKERLVLK
jgi:hypothetical protein